MRKNRKSLFLGNFLKENIFREALKGQSIKRLAERGLCLSRLRYQYTYTGLYGRTILVFDGEALSRTQTFGPGLFDFHFY